MILKRLFTYKLTQLSHYVDKQHLDALEEEFIMDLESNRETVSEQTIERFIFFLFNQITQNIEEAKKVTWLMKELRKHLAYTASEMEKQKIILDYAYRFNPSKKELEKEIDSLESERKHWKIDIVKDKKKVAELESFSKIAVGRELRMIELKKQITKLKKKS